MKDELDRQREETTHGRDGALLGTEWVNLSLGHEQCSFVLPRWASYTCCALRSGHQHGHRTPYVGDQPAQSSWIVRGGGR